MAIYFFILPILENPDPPERTEGGQGWVGFFCFYFFNKPWQLFHDFPRLLKPQRPPIDPKRKKKKKERKKGVNQKANKIAPKKKEDNRVT